MPLGWHSRGEPQPPKHQLKPPNNRVIRIVVHSPPAALPGPETGATRTPGRTWGHPGPPHCWGKKMNLEIDLPVSSCFQRIKKKKIFIIFSFFPPQSPEEIDEDKVHLSDSERKVDPSDEDANVYTEKHSDNLFKRTEVLAGE